MHNPKLDLLTHDKKPDHTHRSAAANGVRRAVHRPPEAEQQCCSLAEGGTDFQHAHRDHDYRGAQVSDYTYPDLLAIFPDHPIVEQTSMNSWNGQKVRSALAKSADCSAPSQACRPSSATLSSHSRRYITDYKAMHRRPS